MVTGASTADLAIVLVDARKGIVAQSKRHAFISSLLGIPHVVVCVNKMDLVEFEEEVFDQIVEEFDRFAARLELPDVTFIPISALMGDNVVERSSEMPWYQGPPLLYHLEHVHIASDRNLIDVRFPVQWVVRPQAGWGKGGELRLPRLRRPGRGRDHARGRRRGGAAGRPALDDRQHRHLRRRGRRGVPADVCRDPAERRHRRLARLDARTGPQPTDRLEPLRGARLLDERAAASTGPALRRQAHDALGDGRERRGALPDRRRDAPPRRACPDPGAQRPRARTPRAELAARVRLLPPQPAHRQPDRDRRGNQRHGGCRRDPRHRGRGHRRAPRASAARTYAGRARG